MNGLLQLSAIACERLDESSPSGSPSPTNASSSSSVSSQENVIVPKLPREAIMTKLCTVPCSQPNKPTAASLLPSDRNAIREKIKSAFRKRAAEYEDLLCLCSAVTEEFVCERAPSKLDYYKNGVQCVKKIFDKRNFASSTEVETTDKPEYQGSEDSAPKAVKRAKTQH